MYLNFWDCRAVKLKQSVKTKPLYQLCCTPKSARLFSRQPSREKGDVAVCSSGRHQELYLFLSEESSLPEILPRKGQMERNPIHPTLYVFPISIFSAMSELFCCGFLLKKALWSGTCLEQCSSRVWPRESFEKSWLDINPQWLDLEFLVERVVGEVTAVRNVWFWNTQLDLEGKKHYQTIVRAHCKYCQVCFECLNLE